MENKKIENNVKEKRFELILKVFNKIDFKKLEFPTEYNEETFYDFLKWKIGSNISFRYDKQLTFIYTQKNKELQNRLLINLERDFIQEEYEILSNIYFEFGKK